MVYVQKVEEDNLRDKEEYRNKNATRTRSEFRQQKGGPSRPQLQKQKGSAQSSASALVLETKVSIMDIIRRTSKLDHHSLKKVWHTEVVGIMYVLSLVDST